MNQIIISPIIGAEGSVQKSFESFFLSEKVSNERRLETLAILIEFQRKVNPGPIELRLRLGKMGPVKENFPVKRERLKMAPNRFKGAS